MLRVSTFIHFALTNPVSAISTNIHLQSLQVQEVEEIFNANTVSCQRYRMF